MNKNMMSQLVSTKVVGKPMESLNLDTMAKSILEMLDSEDVEYLRSLKKDDLIKVMKDIFQDNLKVMEILENKTVKEKAYLEELENKPIFIKLKTVAQEKNISLNASKMSATMVTNLGLGAFIISFASPKVDMTNIN